MTPPPPEPTAAALARQIWNGIDYASCAGSVEWMTPLLQRALDAHAQAVVAGLTARLQAADQLAAAVARIQTCALGPIAGWEPLHVKLSERLEHLHQLATDALVVYRAAGGLRCRRST